MKLVKEYINEKFIEDSDPIRDMGIGLIDKIKKWLANNTRIELKYKNKLPYIINEDGTIDTFGGVWICGDLNDTTMPDYIKFNIIHGYFDIGHRNILSLKGCPEIVYGYFRCSSNKLISLVYSPKEVYDDYYCGYNPGNFTTKDVKKYCKFAKKICLVG